MMENYYAWIASLPSQKLWSLFVLVCAIMAFIPYSKITIKYLRIFFQNEKPAILDFSWRVAEDHYLYSVKGKKFYLNASKQNFILEGGKLLLNWNVKGAYRIDVLPIGKNMKGNTAFIVARKTNTVFTLIAYTKKGKIKKELIINASLFRQLNTLNLSKEDQFHQSTNDINTTSFSTKNLMEGKYSESRLSKLPSINTLELQPKSKPIYYYKQISFMHLWFDRKIWKIAQRSYFNQNKLNRIPFRPNKYKDERNLNEKLIS